MPPTRLCFPCFFALPLLFLHSFGQETRPPSIVPSVLRRKQQAVGNGTEGFPLPPDTRPDHCPKSFESPDLSLEGGWRNLRVSIVLPYHQEQWEHMHATMLSLLYFTPDQYIQEFIMMSDGNSPELTFEEELLKMSPKVKMLKNEQREGLIRAKMKAVDHALGDVLVFMEAHCRANRGWLEPLLIRLAESPRSLVQPSLDVIPEHDFSGYYPTQSGLWRFEWNLNLVFVIPRDQSQNQPIYPSPATSGGIFAIRKDWWTTLRLYDPELYQWGGDHVEATLKIWRCGGLIEVHTCSRIGHLFREAATRPYPVDVSQVVRNYNRLAHVWLDDYIEHFYKVKPEARSMELGPGIEEQLQAREELQCKSMSWYLKHVDPEMEWEADHICIPGGSAREGGCAGQHAAHGRSTLDKTMPDELLRLRRLDVLHEYYSPGGFWKNHDTAAGDSDGESEEL